MRMSPNFVIQNIPKSFSQKPNNEPERIHKILPLSSNMYSILISSFELKKKIQYKSSI